MSRTLSTFQSDDADLIDENEIDSSLDSRAARKRKINPKHKPKKSEQEIVSELSAEAAPLVPTTLTYQPSRFEAEWLMESLKPFFDRGLITDIVELVRGGKEASVYMCAAHELLGVPYVAAKVYRPRMFRQMRNDAVYREGREVVSDDGKLIKNTDNRIMRAIGKKSSYGVQVAHTSWLMYEHNTLKALYAAGVDVPQVYSAGSNALLMTYVGDLHRPAPTLSMVELDEQEAHTLFARTMRNIETMLMHGVVHGDLSSYNLLYWEGTLTLIDFPQATNPELNPNAPELFTRDVLRVCEYFADQGVDADAEALADRLWQTYVKHGAQKRMLENLILEEEEDYD
ncbi:MAG: RIO1 family regulatory kinase/ATPase [Chloroflexota bacterium]|nr:RIO1 family regulatory kinase/ATPase [Chloroflexota bacterium]